MAIARSRAARALCAAGAILLAAACAGCSLIDPYNVFGRVEGEAAPVPTEFVPSPGAKRLSRQAREHAFHFVWSTIEERYHDPAFNGADWKAIGERYRPLALDAKDDDAFWDVLDRMTGELRDSHTRVESPREVELRKRHQAISLGIAILPVEGRLAVATVDRNSDAWWAGVRPGMVVTSIDGRPAAQAYEELLAQSRRASTDRARHFAAMRRLALAGAEGSHVAFGFERADGTPLAASLPRRRIDRPRVETQRLLPSGFGYIRFSEWTFGLALRASEAVDAMRNAPGLVIDLRGNPGGSVYAVNEMLEKFFTRRTELGRTTTRNGTPVSVLFGAVDIIKLHREVQGSPNAYRGPVVILLNEASASGSELFAGTMQAAGRAQVLGRPSCGCLLGFLGYAHVPGGGELAYSEVGFVLSNGRHIEGDGVIPDVDVPLTLSDLRLERDRTLEQAQAVLARLAKKP